MKKEQGPCKCGYCRSGLANEGIPPPRDHQHVAAAEPSVGEGRDTTVDPPFPLLQQQAKASHQGGLQQGRAERDAQWLAWVEEQRKVTEQFHPEAVDVLDRLLVRAGMIPPPRDHQHVASAGGEERDATDERRS